MDQEQKRNEAELREERSHKTKRRAAAAAVALTASGGLVLGGLFNDPAAMLEQSDLSPAQVVSEDDDSGDELEGGGSAGEEEKRRAETYAEQSEQEQPGGLRQAILSLPYAVRLLVLLPLWGLGWLVQTVSAALWTAVLSPVLGKALSWLLLLGALLGALVLAGKTLFPDLPIKKILNKRSVLGLVIGSVLLGVLDIVLPLFWDDYAQIEAVARAVGIGLVFCGVTLSFAIRERRRRARAAKAASKGEAAAPKKGAKRPMTQQEILALADSVSGGK